MIYTKPVLVNTRPKTAKLQELQSYLPGMYCGMSVAAIAYAIARAY